MSKQWIIHAWEKFHRRHGEHEKQQGKLGNTGMAVFYPYEGIIQSRKRKVGIARQDNEQATKVLLKAG